MSTPGGDLKGEMAEIAQHEKHDVQSLTGLDRRFRGPLNAYFRRRLPSAAEVEDFTQEVFLRLTRHRENMTFQNVEALVFTIAANLLRDRARREATRGPPALSVEQDQMTAADPNLVEGIDAERVLLAKNDLNLALVALSELGERTRDVFVLQRLEGLQNKEVARELGISVSAVEKHMVRALSHIARRVGA
jgi:RNA polymerase sigma-70 factor (ECF subfamily)